MTSGALMSIKVKNRRKFVDLGKQKNIKHKKALPILCPSRRPLIWRAGGVSKRGGPPKESGRLLPMQIGSNDPKGSTLSHRRALEPACFTSCLLVGVDLVEV